MLLALLACTAAAPDTGKPDGDADTDTDADTDADANTDTDTDTDSGDPPLPGNVDVAGTYAGTAFAFACDETDPPETFDRYWGTAVGDTVGSFTCTEGGTLTVTFINPRPGTWTSPDSADFFFTDASGGGLSYWDPVPRSWTLTLDEATFVDATTMTLTGSLAGTWTEGDVAATFSLQLPCPTCQ
ncbi:MAG: hypothetical protein ACOZNI_00975 [Myxococcota bacterium]